MKVTVYIPDAVVQAAGKRYHRAKSSDYTMSELVRVGLTILATKPVLEIRKRVPEPRVPARKPSRPDIPGLTQYRPTKSD